MHRSGGSGKKTPFWKVAAVGGGVVVSGLILWKLYMKLQRHQACDDDVNDAFTTPTPAASRINIVARGGEGAVDSGDGRKDQPESPSDLRARNQLLRKQLLLSAIQICNEAGISLEEEEEEEEKKNEKNNDKNKGSEGNNNKKKPQEEEEDVEDLDDVSTDEELEYEVACEMEKLIAWHLARRIEESSSGPQKGPVHYRADNKHVKRTAPKRKYLDKGTREQMYTMAIEELAKEFISVVKERNKMAEKLELDVLKKEIYSEDGRRDGNSDGDDDDDDLWEDVDTDEEDEEMFLNDVAEGKRMIDLTGKGHKNPYVDYGYDDEEEEEEEGGGGGTGHQDANANELLRRMLQEMGEDEDDYYVPDDDE